MTPAALNYYRNGPSFLNRYIPFWITNPVQKILAVLVAVFAVILPLARYIPKLRDWYVGKRFHHWYSELHALETAAAAAPDSARRNDIAAELRRIEDNVRAARLPPSFAAQRYSMREHIDLVRRRLGGAPS